MRKLFKILQSLKYFLLILLAGLSLTFLVVKGTKPSQAAVTETISDLNGDGKINLIDARILSPPATTNCPVCVDVNGDKSINQTDLDLVNHRIPIGNPSENSIYQYNSRYDINNDGVISLDDVNIVNSYLGQAVSGPVFGLDDPSELTFGYKAKTLLVKFKGGTAAGAKVPVFVKYKLNHKYTFQSLNTDELEITEGNVEDLKKQIKNESEVESVYKDYLEEPQTDDPGWLSQWGHQRIRIEETWYTETTGNWNNPVGVAVIDTGFDVNHSDLQLNISSRRRNGAITDPNDPAYSDVSGEEDHGTATSGIIGATANNNEAIAGINWRVELVLVKSGGSESTFARGVEWAMNQSGVKVMNISLCFGYDEPTSHLSNDILTQARNDHAITIIAAAGNDGRNDSCYPANHDKVVSVGATMGDDTLWADTSGREDADVFAPGHCITILRAGGYYSMCNDGTSLAAPHVSGVAALCRAVAPLGTEFLREDLKCRNFEMTAYGRIDAWSTIWYRNCSKWDFNGNGRVDATDSQNLAFRYNYPPLYNILYDIAPVGTDGKIDMADVWVIVSRTNLNCPPR